MFSHIVLGANDLEQSKKFYDAILGATGGNPAGPPDPKGRIVYMHRGAILIVGNPIDGEAASGANGGTVGFTCESTEEVDAWHKAGVEAGGTSIEDPPGIRETPFGNLYLAYLRDPAGNKLCGMHRMG